MKHGRPPVRISTSVTHDNRTRCKRSSAERIVGHPRLLPLGAALTVSPGTRCVVEPLRLPVVVQFIVKERRTLAGVPGDFSALLAALGVRDRGGAAQPALSEPMAP